VSEETIKPRPSLKRLVIIILVALIGPVAVGLGGFYIYMSGGRFVSTENAYVKTEKIAISADISGRVIVVGTAENEKVQRGDLLFMIDDEPLRLSLKQAEARLAAVKQELLALRASYRQKVADLKLAKGDVEFYESQFKRQKKLGTKGIVSQSSLDEYRNNLRAARDRIASVQQDIQQVLANLGGSLNRKPEQHPKHLEAQATLDRVALDLKRVEVRAPASGVVTNFELQVGEYIQSGKPVFSLVGDEEIWLQANFKETDLTNVKPGQSAIIQFDAFPDVVGSATVSGIAPATGSEFALLPPQNASGNWIKVVQRLPVRLHFSDRGKLPKLRAGMSVEVEIDTGHKRKLPSFIRSSFAWAKGRK
jgi:membrane fusion protein, multidrug efflux system